MISDTKEIMLSTGKERELTKIQKNIIKSICNFNDERSIEEKCKDCGVTPSQWRRWLKNRTFALRLNEELMITTDGRISRAWQKLCEKIEEGNIPAISLFFRAKKIIGNETQNVHNTQINVISDNELVEKAKSLGLELPKRVSLQLEKKE